MGQLESIYDNRKFFNKLSKKVGALIGQKKEICRMIL
jgi:hypothetical protein